MGERPWTWWVSAALLLASGSAAAGSTYLHWLPCRGSMLSGSILCGYQYGPDFSDACLRRMDGGMPFLYLSERSEQVPWAAELAVAAMLLVGLAWLVPVMALRRQARMKVLLGLPGLTNLILALVAWSARGSAISFVSDYLWLIVDLSTLVAALVFHGLFSYAFMGTLSDANWDVPPGTGYLTAAVLVFAAVLTMILTWASERRPTEVLTPPAQLTTVP